GGPRCDPARARGGPSKRQKEPLGGRADGRARLHRHAARRWRARARSDLPARWKHIPRRGRGSVIAEGEMGEAAGSDCWAIDQAMAEYEAYRAGALQASMHIFQAPGGAVQYCGAENDQEHWTVAYIRAGDEAVTPLAVGAFAQVVGTFTRL